jgi:hypothetical protein
VQTFLSRDATPGKALEFTIAGTGSFGREEQNGNGGQEAGAPSTGPGGGIGEPINTPDPLSKYRWWILGGLALLLAAAAAFLLRRPAGAVVALAGDAAAGLPSANTAAATPGAKNTALLNVLKEELFALESEKIAGTLSENEYAEQKAALETVLKRALKRS